MLSCLPGDVTASRSRKSLGCDLYDSLQLPKLVNTGVNVLLKWSRVWVICGLIVSLNVLSKAPMRELNRGPQFDARQPCSEQGDDMTNAPNPLSNPQSRCRPTEVPYVA